MLKVRINPEFEAEAKYRPFMETLREMNAENFLDEEDRKFPELLDIQQSAWRNDESLTRLCALKPEHKESYLRQWKEAEGELERRAARLKIKILR